MDILEKISKKATKLTKAPEHLSYKKRLRELELFSLENRRLGEILSVFTDTL